MGRSKKEDMWGAGGGEGDKKETQHGGGQKGTHHGGAKRNLTSGGGDKKEHNFMGDKKEHNIISLQCPFCSTDKVVVRPPRGTAGWSMLQRWSAEAV